MENFPPAPPPDKKDAIIVATGLGKRYRLGATKKKSMGFADHLRGFRDMFRKESDTDPNSIWALDRVSFEVGRGERVGIIGRNGAGKSTLLKIMSRIVPPTTGEVRIQGRLTSLLEVGTGFNDNLTGRENVFLNASLYGLSRSEIAARFDEIVAFSEIARFIDTPVKAYSSGMKMRLAFAVAAHLGPDILLMDEVLAVGDMAFQRKCLEKVDDMTSGGRTLFFVSHSMDAVMRYCDRCIWLDAGQIRLDGASEDVVAAYVEAVLGVRSKVKRSAPAVEQAPAPAPEARKVAAGESESRDTPTPAGTTPATTQEVAPTKLDPAAVQVVEAKRDTQFAEPATVHPTPVPVATAEETGEVRPIILPEATAFLREGSVRDSAGAERSVFRVDQSINVHLSYAITEPGLYLPAIHVYCPQGTLAFVSCPPDADPEHFRSHGEGQHDAVVEIPPHLLNIGTYRVSLVVFSPDESPFKRHFTAEQALSFHCVEAAPGELSARGMMPRQFPGPVRPLLRWTVTVVEETEDAAAPFIPAAGRLSAGRR